MLAGLKLFERKEVTAKKTLEPTGVLKKYTKITGKQLRQGLFLIELQGYCKFFTGDYFSNFQWFLWSNEKI